MRERRHHIAASANLDFFAVEADQRAVLNFLFSSTDVRVLTVVQKREKIDLTVHPCFGGWRILVDDTTQPIDDPELGHFSWDERYKFWMGGIDVPRGNVAYLTIHVGPEDRQAMLALARDTVAWLLAAEPEARSHAAVELLQEQRSEWTAKEPPDVEGAVRQMVLNSVATDTHGIVELAYGGPVCTSAEWSSLSESIGMVTVVWRSLMTNCPKKRRRAGLEPD